jgi:hypothetical protein
MKCVLCFALGWGAATLFYFGLWLATEIADLDVFEGIFF